MGICTLHVLVCPVFGLKQSFSVSRYSACGCCLDIYLLVLATKSARAPMPGKATVAVKTLCENLSISHPRSLCTGFWSTCLWCSRHTLSCPMYPSLIAVTTSTFVCSVPKTICSISLQVTPQDVQTAPVAMPTGPFQAFTASTKEACQWTVFPAWELLVTAGSPVAIFIPDCLAVQQLIPALAATAVTADDRQK